MDKLIVATNLLVPFFGLVAVLLFCILGVDCRRFSRLILASQLAIAGGSLFLLNWHEFEATTARIDLVWSDYLHSNFSVGADPLSQCALFFALIPFVTSIFIGRERSRLSLPQHMAIHLLGFGLAGAFLSANMLTFCFFWGFTTLSVALLLSGDQILSQNNIVAKSLLVEISSLLLLSLGVVGLQQKVEANLSSWFSLTMGAYLIDERSLLFVIVILGLLLRGWLFPCSLYRFGWNRPKALALVLPLFIHGTISTFAILKFVPKIFPEEWLAHGAYVASLAALTYFISALRLLYKSDREETIFSMVSLYQALSILGLASVNMNGILGAWVVFFFCYLMLALMGYFLYVGESSSGGLQPDLAFRSLFVRSGATMVDLAAAGAPISIGCVGLLLVFWGLSLWSAPTCLFMACGMPLVWLATFQRMKTKHVMPSNWMMPDIVWFFCLIGLAICSLIFSYWFIEILRPSVEYTLALFGGRR